MSFLPDLAARLRSLWSLLTGRSEDRELDEEIRFHIEKQIEKNVAAGMSRKEARRQAHIKFGGVERMKERTREARGILWFENFIRDLLIAARTLVKAPSFSVVMGTTLALGVGASAGVFTVVNGILLRPLPFEKPEALVSIRYDAPGLGLEDVPSSDGMYFTYREEAQTLEDVGVWTERRVAVINQNGLTRVSAAGVTASLFSVLGIEPTVGRLFLDTDDQPGATETVVLSHDYWQTRFASDPGVVGRIMRVDGRPRAILGVLPARFSLPGSDAVIYIPLQWNPNEADFGGFAYEMIARLAGDASLEGAAADVARMIRIGVERYDYAASAEMLEEAGFAPDIRTLRTLYVGDIAGMLWLLFAAAGVIFLVACANAGNLSLARAESRRREVAIRTAVGAGRRGIARHFLTESLLIGVIGWLLGTAFAVALVRLVQWTAPEGLPRMNEIAVDPATATFAAGATVIAVLLVGLLPMLRVDAIRPLQALQASGGCGSGGSLSRDRRRARSVLVIAQIAMAVVVLAGSALMVRSFFALRSVDPGFSGAEDVLTFRVSIPESEIQSEREVAVTYEELVQMLEEIRGVESVSATSSLPLESRAIQDPLLVEDVPWSGDDIPPIRRFEWVMPGYFRTLGNSLLVGRELEWADIHDAAPVAVVTEDFAAEYWSEPASAIGKRIAMPSSTAAAENRWHEIVGVVGNVRDDGLDQSPQPTIFWPLVMSTGPASGPGELDVPRTMSFVMRSANPSALVSEVREALSGLNAGLPLSDVETLDRLLARSMSGTALATVVLLIAAAATLILAIVGVYGVVSFVAGLRTNEFGVRLAVGARRDDLKRMVLGQGARLASYGIGAGLLAAFGTTRLMSSLLYGVEATNPVTYLLAAASLGAVALFASYWPAVRASRTDPIKSLRFE